MTKLRTLALAILATTSSTALAGPNGAQAQVLFDHAQTLLKDGKIAEACAAFDASEKLEPATTTIVKLADCREKNAQYATAWGLYLQAERELRALTDANAAGVREVVKQRAAKLEPRLSSLAIRVPAGSQITGLEIIRDNDRVEPGAWNQPLPIDGGTFRISARAPDRREWTTTVVVRPERDAQVVDVPALSSTQGEAPKPVPVAASPVVTLTPVVTPMPAPAPASAPIVDAPPPTASRVLPVSLGASALVLGGAAIGLEVWSGHAYDSAKAATDRPTQVDLWNSANDRRYLAEGVGVAALGCAGVAVYVALHHRHAEAQPSPSVSLAPLASPHLAGLVLDGRW